MSKLEWQTDSNTTTNDTDKDWMEVMEEAYQKWLKDLEAGDTEAANYK
ncbi:MAG: hypothetical protein WBB28_14620 [Crinalium sp.]